MDIMTSIATDHTVPFRTRERLGALPTLAPITVPVQGTTVSAAGMAVAAFGYGAGADARNPEGDLSASFLVSPL